MVPPATNCFDDADTATERTELAPYARRLAVLYSASPDCLLMPQALAAFDLILAIMEPIRDRYLEAWLASAIAGGHTSRGHPMPTDPTPKDPRGGPRWGHPGRRSNTGVRGVSEVHRPGRPPQFSVAWRDATGRRRTAWFPFTERDRPDVLARAAAHYVQHHVPAAPPPAGGR